jgi:transcriptional regulator with XRE-family HTH domain
MIKGELIRKWAEENGLSKEGVAFKLNKSLATVQNLYAGKEARVDTLTNLARLMGCTINDLIVDAPNVQSNRRAAS